MNANDMRELATQIENELSSHWEFNEPAHRVEHFRDVLETGIHIANHVGYYLRGENGRLMVLAAYFHDLFAWSRINHHTLSAEYTRDTDHPLFNELSSKGRVLLSDACREHRASYKGKFSSSFSELVNAADYGIPHGTRAMLERAMAYRQAHNPHESFQDSLRESALHLKEKFSREGYAVYPAMYRKAFNLELERQYVDIEKIDIHDEDLLSEDHWLAK